MAEKKAAGKGAPSGASEPIRAQLSPHLPRLRERMLILPRTEEVNQALELLDSLIEHWDQFNTAQKRNQTLAATVWIGEIEHRARLDLLIESGLRRKADNAKGGKSRGAPDWHEKCVAYAKSLRATGVEGHELVGKLMNRFRRADDRPYDPKTIRTVLKKAGVK